METTCDLQVKRVRTSLTPQELVQALVDSHFDVFGRPVSPSRLRMAWAHVSIENGRGRDTFNNNLGNIGKEAYGSTGPYYKVARSSFKSFPTARSGGIAYWNTLRQRCPSVIPRFDASDVMGAATYLERCGYYSNNVENYQKSLASLFGEAKNFIIW